MDMNDRGEPISCHGQSGWMVQALTALVSSDTIERTQDVRRLLIEGDPCKLSQISVGKIVALSHMINDTDPSDASPSSTERQEVFLHRDELLAATQSMSQLTVDEEALSQWLHALDVCGHTDRYQKMFRDPKTRQATSQEVTQHVVSLLQSLVQGANLDYDAGRVGSMIMTQHTMVAFWRAVMGAEKNGLALSEHIRRATLGGSPAPCPEIHLNAKQQERLALLAGLKSMHSPVQHAFVLDSKMDVSELVDVMMEQCAAHFEQYVQQDTYIPMRVRVDGALHQLNSMEEEWRLAKMEPIVMGWRKTRVTVNDGDVLQAMRGYCADMVNNLFQNPYLVEDDVPLNVRPKR